MSLVGVPSRLMTAIKALRKNSNPFNDTGRSFTQENRRYFREINPKDSARDIWNKFETIKIENFRYKTFYLGECFPVSITPLKKDLIIAQGTAVCFGAVRI